MLKMATYNTITPFTNKPTFNLSTLYIMHLTCILFWDVPISFISSAKNPYYFI